MDMPQEPHESRMPVEEQLREASAFADTLVGMTHAAATELAEQRGYVVRTVRPDNEDPMLYLDLLPHRITLWVNQGAVVTRSTAG